MKNISVLTGLLFGGLLTCASHAQFINGGFESISFHGWERGSGDWTGGPLNSADYFAGGSRYYAGADASGIVSSGWDPNTDGNLNMVYSGNYSARVNDSSQNFSVSAISQTVTNYTDPTIFFAWAAVLENSHGPTDSDNFTLTLINETKGLTLYSTAYNSATAPAGLFTTSSTYWQYTDWQVQSLDVSAYSGDTFTLQLLASDCPYGAHAGYVYLDGFGAVLPPVGEPGLSAVPEPSTYGLIAAAGLLGAVAIKRRRKAAAAAAPAI